jgi:glutathione S-transferase
VLLDGDLTIWDSLAICEYRRKRPAVLAERHRCTRACAVPSAEMHSGFQALRNACPFNARARDRHVPQTPELVADVQRIDQMWEDCRRRFGRAGPWLFGEYSIADAMYSSVVLRFNTYGAELCASSREYMNTVLADPHIVDWLRAAALETDRVEAIDAVGR